MYKLILKKIINLPAHHPELLNKQVVTTLFTDAAQDLAAFTHINFYAVDADRQMAEHLAVIDRYISAISQFKKQFSSHLEQHSLKLELNEITTLLKNKRHKLAGLGDKIPQGMLDVKRALTIALGHKVSSLDDEDKALKKALTRLQGFMASLNKKFMGIMHHGGAFKAFLSAITTLHWQQLSLYQGYLNELYAHFKQSRALSTEGQLIKTCIATAIQSMPHPQQIHHALQTLQGNIPNKINFASECGQRICRYLAKQGKPYFYMPYRDDMYHFDYDPTNDLSETGGNCFGESFMFMQSLQMGKFKCFCPELALINFQLDQSRKLKFGQETIGRAETEVFEGSQYQSLQWADAQDLFFNNANFKVGDICGLLFSMNAYTLSQRDFTPGHIAVVAKVDTRLSPYQYIIFEKDFGAFGLVDDASLTYVISKVLMPLYQGMSYSKMKLVKFAEASSSTYELLASLKPLSEKPKEAIARSSAASFFNTVGVAQEAAQSQNAVSSPK